MFSINAFVLIRVFCVVYSVKGDFLCVVQKLDAFGIYSLTYSVTDAVNFSAYSMR